MAANYNYYILKILQNSLINLIVKLVIQKYSYLWNEVSKAN